MGAGITDVTSFRKINDMYIGLIEVFFFSLNAYSFVIGILGLFGMKQDEKCDRKI